MEKRLHIELEKSTLQATVSMKELDENPTTDLRKKNLNSWVLYYQSSLPACFYLQFWRETVEEMIWMLRMQIYASVYFTFAMVSASVKMCYSKSRKIWFMKMQCIGWVHYLRRLNFVIARGCEDIMQTLKLTLPNVVIIICIWRTEEHVDGCAS